MAFLTGVLLPVAGIIAGIIAVVAAVVAVIKKLGRYHRLAVRKMECI
ncbi:hypothetical protein [Mediterraneibacter gnavus]|nr:hypothetical protein [Mediterraneibacter gnavus]